MEFELFFRIALRRGRKKKRTMWVHPIFSLRRKQGGYNIIKTEKTFKNEQKSKDAAAKKDLLQVE